MAKEFGDKLENLDLTNDEVKRLAECMKDKKFMELLKDYADEISNPENKKKYEEEIAMMERERGNNVKFINPTPCYVMKSSCNGKEKCFINICTSKEVGEPACKPSVKDSSKGMQWTIPHSISQPREDVDKAGLKCMVYDVIFNPDTCHMAEKNARFRKMIEDIALDAIERNFDTNLDKVNVKKPKMKYKGSPQASIIRTPSGDGKPLVQDPKDPLAFPYPPTGHNTKVSETSDVKFQGTTNSASISVEESPKVNEFVEPKYTFVHRGYFDIKKYYAMSDQTVASTRPRELILNVELPMLKSAAPLELEISENRVFLECTKPVKYRLDIKLPYPIDESKGNAKFEKNKKRLVITMEVIPPVIQNYANGLNKDECCHTDDSECTGRSDNDFEDVGDHSAPALLPNSLIEDRTVCRHENLGSMWEKPYSEDNATEECDPLVLNSPDLINTLSHADKDKVFEKIRPHMLYHQTDDLVVIIIKIKSINCDRLWYNISSSELQFSAMTDNEIQIHQLYLRFDGSDEVDPQRSKVDVSGDNAVFTLRKHRHSLREWQYFKAGFDEDSMVTKHFLTSDNIEKLMSDTRQEADGNVKMQLECEVLLESHHPKLLALKLTPKSGRAEIDGAESNLKDVPTVLNILDRMEEAANQICAETSIENTSETTKSISNTEQNEEISSPVTKPCIQNENDTDEDDDSSDCGDSDSEANVEIPTMNGDQQNVSDTLQKHDETSKRVVRSENTNHVSLTGQAEQLKSEYNEGGVDTATVKARDKEQCISRDEVLVVREHDKESNTKTEVCIDHKTKSIIKLSNEMLFEIDSD